MSKQAMTRKTIQSQSSLVKPSKISAKVILKNLSSKTIIASDLKEPKSFWAKSLGLLNPKSPSSILITTHFGIHTLFLKQPIDVLIIDDNFLVKKALCLKPYRLLIYNPAYKLIIELPQGTIKKSKTKTGDKIKMIESAHET